MSFHADVALSDVEPRPTVLMLPGGFGSLELALDDGVLGEIRRLAAEPTICFSISTGSLPLAAARLIEGERATGHWLSMTHLERFGAVPVYEPEVVSGRFFTASGAVVAADVAHHVADRVWFGPQVEAFRASIDLGQRA
jgi:transcriptional regulator GlxA family with amidase domain